MKNIIWPISIDNYSYIYNYNINYKYRILNISIIIMIILIVLLYSYEYNNTFTVNFINKINNLIIVNQNIFWFTAYHDKLLFSLEEINLIYNSINIGFDSFDSINVFYYLSFIYYKLSLDQVGTPLLQFLNIAQFRRDTTFALAAYVYFCDIPLLDMMREYSRTTDPFLLFIRRMHFIIVLRPYIYWFGMYTYYYFNWGIHPRWVLTGFDISMMLDGVSTALKRHYELVSWITGANEFIYHTSNILLLERNITSFDTIPLLSLFLSKFKILTNFVIFLPNIFVFKSNFLFDFNVYLPIFIPVESVSQWSGFQVLNVFALVKAVFKFISWHLTSAHTFLGFEVLSFFVNKISVLFDVLYTREFSTAWINLTYMINFYLQLFYVEVVRELLIWLEILIKSIQTGVHFGINFDTPMFYGLWTVMDRFYALILGLLSWLIIPGYLRLVREIIFKDFWLLQIVWNDPALLWRKPRVAEDIQADQMLIMEYLQPKPWFNYDALVMRFQLISFLIGGFVVCVLLLWQILVLFGIKYIFTYSEFGEFVVWSIIFCILLVLIIFVVYNIIRGMLSPAIRVVFALYGDVILFMGVYIMFRLSGLLQHLACNSGLTYFIRDWSWFNNIRRKLLVSGRRYDPFFVTKKSDVFMLVDCWQSVFVNKALNTNFIKTRFIKINSTPSYNKRLDLVEFDSVFASYYDMSHGYIKFYDHGYKK